MRSHCTSLREKKNKSDPLRHPKCFERSRPSRASINTAMISRTIVSCRPPLSVSLFTHHPHPTANPPPIHPHHRQSLPQTRLAFMLTSCPHQPALAHSIRIPASTRLYSKPTSIMSAPPPAISKVPSQLATPGDLTKAQIETVMSVLNPLVADHFSLYIKTKGFHWHASGQSISARSLSYG